MRIIAILFAAVLFSAAGVSHAQTLTVINNVGCDVKLEMFHSDDMCPPINSVTQVFTGFGTTTLVNSPNLENWVGARVVLNSTIRVGDPNNCNNCAPGCGTPPTILTSAGPVAGICTPTVSLTWTSQGCASGSATLVIDP